MTSGGRARPSRCRPPRASSCSGRRLRATTWRRTSAASPTSRGRGGPPPPGPGPRLCPSWTCTASPSGPGARREGPAPPRWRAPSPWRTRPRATRAWWWRGTTPPPPPSGRRRSQWPTTASTSLWSSWTRRAGTCGRRAAGVGRETLPTPPRAPGATGTSTWRASSAATTSSGGLLQEAPSWARRTVGGWTRAPATASSSRCAATTRTLCGYTPTEGLLSTKCLA
mmetsp:Transcript_568/g.1210  ORF Transcript_568/g.1210 Transcript_568/m.1210 type:complete len:225 (-) Transcript_568:966-1640(-)